MADSDSETVVAEPETGGAEAHVRSYFDALARRDPHGMAEHLREDCIEEIVPIGVMRGRAEVQAFFEELFGALPDVETTLKRLVAEGDRVAVEWRMTGNFTVSSFQGVDANGKHLEMRGFDLLEVEDGLITNNTAYYDGMAFARQVGMMPPQDSGAEKAMKSAFNALTKARLKIAERRKDG